MSGKGCRCIGTVVEGLAAGKFGNGASESAHRKAFLGCSQGASVLCAQGNPGRQGACDCKGMGGTGLQISGHCSSCNRNLTNSAALTRPTESLWVAGPQPVGREYGGSGNGCGLL